jgi:hypothetical protein
MLADLFTTYTLLLAEDIIAKQIEKFASEYRIPEIIEGTVEKPEIISYAQAISNFLFGDINGGGGYGPWIFGGLLIAGIIIFCVCQPHNYTNQDSSKTITDVVPEEVTKQLNPINHKGLANTITEIISDQVKEQLNPINNPGLANTITKAVSDEITHKTNLTTTNLITLGVKINTVQMQCDNITQVGNTELTKIDERISNIENYLEEIFS